MNSLHTYTLQQDSLHAELVSAAPEKKEEVFIQPANIPNILDMWLQH